MFRNLMNDITSVKLQIVWAIIIGAHIVYLWPGKKTKNFGSCPLDVFEKFPCLSQNLKLKS
jgi:hypothetical protein